MRTIKLGRLLADVSRRKAALGLDQSPQAVDALRNKGARRTPSKRALLAANTARARRAGVEPVLSY